ncbi:MAG TPA: hypothetical protein VH257_10170, partial [Chloroflexota bacterium]|nr:hypothetical protein [Chloroflexota bacterium]
ELRPSLNLLVLWETDAAYILRHLWLVCPRGGGLTRESVAAYWVTEIPHPTVWRSPAPEARPEAPVEGSDDLDIRPRRAVEVSREVPV